MDLGNQDLKADTSLIVTEKRKRGRPRKDPNEKRLAKARSLAACLPPGYTQLNSSTPRVDPVNDPNEVMIGQTVTGVVEATFDAGYLLAVRIGNSRIMLRGAVFKPGHTSPLTEENDVAPHAEMIRRSEVPFPTEIQPPIRRRRRRKNMQLVTYAGANESPTVPPGKGIVLQPGNFPNGLAINQPAPHLRAAPVHSVLPLAVYPPNGSTSRALESQSGSQFTPLGSGKENFPVKQTYQDPVVKVEPDIGDTNEPLFVEPLQTRHSVQPPPGLGSGN